jgi:predicted site-specific integrase-resolvase
VAQIIRAKEVTMIRYVPLVEAAKFLGLAPQTLYSWKSAGKLSAKHGLRKIEGRVMFDLEELKEAVDRGDLAG